MSIMSSNDFELCQPTDWRCWPSTVMTFHVWSWSLPTALPLTNDRSQAAAVCQQIDQRCWVMLLTKLHHPWSPLDSLYTHRSFQVIVYKQTEVWVSELAKYCQFFSICQIAKNAGFRWNLCFTWNWISFLIIFLVRHQAAGSSTVN